MITRALLILIAAAGPAFGQTSITVMADTNRAVRTNFTIGNAQVTGLSGLFSQKLDVSGNGGSLTNLNPVALSGAVAINRGGTGATNATGARSNLQLGTAATNLASAFQPASSVLTNVAAGDGSTLTNVTVDGSTLTNVSATNLVGSVETANGGTGGTNASSGLANLLPAYASNASKVLAVNTNENGVEWIAAGGGGGGLPETPLAISNGGSGASDVVGVLSNFNLVRGTSITLGTAVTNAGTHSISIGTNARTAAQDAIAIGRDALVSSNQGIAIGYSSLATTNNGTVSDGVAIGYDAWAERGIAIGKGSQATSTGFTTNFFGIAIGNNAYATENGIAVGWDAIGNNGIAIGVLSYISEPNAIAIGYAAEGTATNAIQLGTGTNSTANTIQVFSAGSVTTNAWAGLANSTTFGHYVMAAPTNGTANQVLALNSNATAVVWTTNGGGGGGGLPETPLAISNGGTASTTADGALTNLTIISGNRVKIGQNTSNSTDAGVTIGGSATIASVNTPAVVIGNSAFSSGTQSVVLGPSAKNTNSALGVSIGSGARVQNSAFGGVALGETAIVTASNAVQIGSGSNATATTIQFRSAGSVTTNAWSYLANASTKGGSRMTNTNGETATNTIIGYDGTNYTTNTITVINGIITSWTQ